MAELTDIRETVRRRYAQAPAPPLPAAAAQPTSRRARAPAATPGRCHAARPTRPACSAPRCMTPAAATSSPRRRSTHHSGAVSRPRSPNCSPARSSLTSGLAPAPTSSSPQAGRAGREGDRPGHDRRDARPRSHERQQGRRPRTSSSSRGLPRGDAASRRQRRRRHLQLRREPLRRQAEGHRRSRSRSSARRPFAISDVIADPDMDDATKADVAAWTRLRRRRAHRHRVPRDPSPRGQSRLLRHDRWPCSTELRLRDLTVRAPLAASPR